MAIKHATSKAAGDKLFAGADWNAEHLLEGATSTGNIIFAADKGIKTLVGAHVYLDGDQIIPTGTETKINFNTASYDLGGDFDIVTNHRFVAPVSGYYLITSSATFYNAIEAEFTLFLYINGPPVDDCRAIHNDTTNLVRNKSAPCSVIVHLTAGDYFELYVYQDTGDDLGLYGNKSYTYMSVFLISVA